MNISSELRSLINASLTDGKISSKERKVLMSRAEADGLNLDEFELYLDSLVQEANKDKKNVVQKSVPVFQWIFASKKKNSRCRCCFGHLDRLDWLHGTV